MSDAGQRLAEKGRSGPGISRWDESTPSGLKVQNEIWGQRMRLHSAVALPSGTFINIARSPLTA